MVDIFHPVVNNNSIFKIYQSKDERFIYSILAAIYSNKIDAIPFHQPSRYRKYKQKLNIENIPFPMKKKNIKLF